MTDMTGAPKANVITVFTGPLLNISGQAEPVGQNIAVQVPGTPPGPLATDPVSRQQWLTSSPVNVTPPRVFAPTQRRTW